MSDADTAPGIDDDAFEPPGGVLVWIVVVIELVTFAAGLAAFVAARAEEPQVFAAGRAALSQPIALANTAILLTGGWLMARAVRRVARDDAAGARRHVLGALGAATAFLALKGVEWAGELAHGSGLRKDTFHTYYWLLTGFHVLHVIAAVVILAALARGLRLGRYGAADHGDVEAGGAFWHLCDLVWLVLYPTVYLLGGAP